MTFLFWLLWLFDLVAAVFLVWSMGFRRGFGASTGLQQTLLILLILVLIGGLILRYGVRFPTWAVLFVALPVLGLLLARLFGN